MITGATVEALGERRRARAAKDARLDQLASAIRDDHDRWLAHVAGAAGCAHPIRLVGNLTHVETSTGRITADTHTSAMPDGVLYTPCGNRRASVCPGCAETYRADIYQLVTAGLMGGKTVPATVTQHPVRVPDRHRPLVRAGPRPPHRPRRSHCRAALGAPSSTATTATRWLASPATTPTAARSAAAVPGLL